MDSYSVEKSLLIFFTEILIGDFSKKPFKKKKTFSKNTVNRSFISIIVSPQNDDYMLINRYTL